MKTAHSHTITFHIQIIPPAVTTEVPLLKSVSLRIKNSCHKENATLVKGSKGEVMWTTVAKKKKKKKATAGLYFFFLEIVDEDSTHWLTRAHARTHTQTCINSVSQPSLAQVSPPRHPHIYMRNNSVRTRRQASKRTDIGKQGKIKYPDVEMAERVYTRDETCFQSTHLARCGGKGRHSTPECYCQVYLVSCMR